MLHEINYISVTAYINVLLPWANDAMISRHNLEHPVQHQRYGKRKNWDSFSPSLRTFYCILLCFGFERKYGVKCVLKLRNQGLENVTEPLFHVYYCIACGNSFENLKFLTRLRIRWIPKQRKAADINYKFVVKMKYKGRYM